MKTEIEIKNILGDVLFEYKCEENSLKKTLIKAIESGAKMCHASLRGADLRDTDLRYADLRYTDLSDADLRYADLRYADLSSAIMRRTDLWDTDLRHARIRDADTKFSKIGLAALWGVSKEDLPADFINLCSQQMLFIFQKLKHELPFLKDKLESGEIDGQETCTCLIGTFAKGKYEGIAKVCKNLEFYDHGLHNPAEQWFYQIRPGDTKKDSFFVEHAIYLIDKVLENKIGTNEEYFLT